MRVVRWFAAAAVALLLAGAGLVALGWDGRHPVARVLAIIAVVLALACWRVTTWAHKARVFTELGRDLARRPGEHPEGDGYDPASDPPDRA